MVYRNVTCNFRHFRWCNLGRILNKQNSISSNSLMSVLCVRVRRLCVPNIMSLGVCLRKLNLVKVGAFAWCSVKIHVFSVFNLKEEKLIKKQTYMKTETRKLYSRAFWTFLPNDVKIDPYNFELYRFKVKTFFWDTVYIGLARVYMLCVQCELKRRKICAET